MCATFMFVYFLAIGYHFLLNPSRVDLWVD